MSKKIKLVAAIILLIFSSFCTVAEMFTIILYRAEIFSLSPGISSTITMLDLFLLGVTIFAVLNLIDVITSK